MKIKYVDLLRAVLPMKVLCQKDGIPFLTALDITKNKAALEAALNSYASQKNDLDEKYLQIKEGDSVISDGCEEAYLKALTELNGDFADLDLVKIPPSALASITLPPLFIQSLSFMLDI